MKVGSEYDCKQCGEHVVVTRNNRSSVGKFCAPKCYYAWRREKTRREAKTCPVCEENPILVPGQKTCSAKCGYTLRKSETKKKSFMCKGCGSLYETYTYERGANKAYCSVRCYNSIRNKRPAMAKVKCLACGVEFTRTRAAVDRGDRTFCGRQCYKDYNVGENNPNTREGPRDPNRGPGWRKLSAEIRERDGYECQRCGKSQEDNGEKLSVDHIYPWRSFEDKEKANEKSNLVSLCRPCHSWKGPAERKWLKGDVIALEAYIRSVSGRLQ